MVENTQKQESSETCYKATFEKSTLDYVLTTLPNNYGNISVGIQVCAKILNLNFPNVEISHVNFPKQS